MKTPRDTFLKIDLAALAHNYSFFKNKLKENGEIIAVVKAYAYGHDAISIAQKLEKLGVSYFAVAYVNEGIVLRNAGITTPILVLHPQRNDAEVCVQYQLEPNIYSFNILENFLRYLQQFKVKNLPIHLKFNTGLNRLGFVKKDISKLTNLILKNNSVYLQSVFSHLIASEDHQLRDITLQQINQYREIVFEIKKYISTPFFQHLTNTSGTLNFPEAHFDKVRIGIGLYGYGNEKKWTDQLKNVASLHSIITQIHSIEQGASVGYNQGFIAQKETITATIPLGHADGIPRSWGKGKGYVTIHEKKAPILGNVCMDMIMVDVTHIACLEGDSVTVFDHQEIVEHIAAQVGTIPYELLTAISQRVPRIVINQ